VEQARTSGHTIFAASLTQNHRLTKKEFIDLLSRNLGHQPTTGQLRLFNLLTDFLASQEKDRVFLLRGYAGTGKTSIVKALVKTFPSTQLKTQLLAPTGRAAKVLAAYSGQPAYTIHKRIYFTQSGDLGMHFSLQRNLFKKTLFIVDEASMIGGENADSEHNLLADLIEYVMSGDDCRLMLIGDNAQLPPVGLEDSPAIDKAFLERNHYLKVTETLLDEVVRQGEDSGILWNATKIRDQLNSGENVFPNLHTKEFPDVFRITGQDLEDHLNFAFGRYGAEEVLVVTRSNKNAGLYNRQIRARIHWQEEEIANGDHLMIVRNNYFWLPEESKQGFIANGDTAEILKLGKRYTKGNYRFADAQIRFVDYPEQAETDVRLLLNTLDSNQANLTYNEQKEIYALVEEDYMDVPLKVDRRKKLKQDPFINALQVKFAYAVTCHKAQGGQWKCVFVDQGFLQDDMLDRSFLRWLYTAVTRATERLYLVNFSKEFFPDEETETFY
jgi:exodeoxyribonuclease-5